ncbi:MAG TPA: MFS transporter, partial [Ktedonobacterales bacterium]|nr:MFS transporter [Ktedonobacterales bacterium]
MSMFKTLRNANFARLWCAGLISQAGDWVLLIGLPIYVYILTRSLLATSITFAAGIVPQIVLGSVAGVFVDRWNRKRTLVIANLLLAAALLPLMLVRTPDHVWIVYIVIFAETCFEQFTLPAQNALLPALVTEEQLVPANALNSLSSNLSRLVGPALGGVIAGFFGLNGIVVADTVSFLLAALVLTGIPAAAAKGATSQRPAGDEPFASLRREWSDGLRVLFGSRTLWVLVATFTISALGEGVFGVLYPVFVYQALHGGALEIGELMSAQAVGGLLGGLVAGWLGQRLLSRWSIGLNWLAFGAISIAIYGAPAWLTLAGLTLPVLWVEVGLFIAVGISGVGVLTGSQSRLQTSAPEAYLGRIFGILGTAMGAFTLVGTLIAGTVSDTLGVIPVLNIQAAGKLLAGVLALALLPGMAHSLASIPASDASDNTVD